MCKLIGVTPPDKQGTFQPNTQKPSGRAPAISATNARSHAPSYCRILEPPSAQNAISTIKLESKLNQQLYRLLKTTHPSLQPPLKDIDQFLPWRADKRDILVQQGGTTPVVRFLVSGLARLYFVDVNGNEQTKFFLRPGLFLVPIHSLIFDKQSWFSIQAVVNCSGVAVDAGTFKSLLKTDRQWADYWLSYITQLFVAKENRERDLLTMSGREKYLNLLANEPEIVLHAPLHQIASYLGITDVTLSRIRRDI